MHFLIPFNKLVLQIHQLFLHSCSIKYHYDLIILLFKAIFLQFFNLCFHQLHLFHFQSFPSFLLKLYRKGLWFHLPHQHWRYHHIQFPVKTSITVVFKPLLFFLQLFHTNLHSDLLFIRLIQLHLCFLLTPNQDCDSRRALHILFSPGEVKIQAF